MLCSIKAKKLAPYATLTHDSILASACGMVEDWLTIQKPSVWILMLVQVEKILKMQVSVFSIFLKLVDSLIIEAGKCSSCYVVIEVV